MKRSKKQSDGSGVLWQPDEDFTVYLDENLHKCKLVIGTLDRMGVCYQKHCDFFPKPGTPDTEWLPVIGNRRWFPLTTDKHFRYNDLERRGLTRYKVGVFQFAKNQYGAEAMAAALEIALPKMKRIANDTPRPFLASISKNGNVNLLWPLLTKGGTLGT